MWASRATEENTRTTHRRYEIISLARTTAIHRRRRGCEYIVAPPSKVIRWLALLQSLTHLSALWSQEPVKRERTTYRWWGPSGSRAHTGGGTHKRDVNEFDTDILESEWKMAKHAQKTLQWQSPEFERSWRKTGLWYRTLLSEQIHRSIGSDPRISPLIGYHLGMDLDTVEDHRGGDGFIYLSTGWHNLSYHDHAPIDRACRSQRPDKGMSYD